MSRQIRRRMTVIVLGGLVVGAPMLAIGSASAQPLLERTRAVTFSGGGVLGLACDSRPSVESMTVPARSTIRVVNETGFPARLMLGDDPQGTLPDDSSADVVVRRGTTSVLLKPSCAVDDGTSPVVITASPPSSPATRSKPAPAVTSPDVAPMLAPPGSDRTPARSPAQDDTSTVERPRAEPGPSADTHSRPAHQSLPASRAPGPVTQAMPRRGASSHPRIKTRSKTVAGTPGSATPAAAGMPPGDSPAPPADVPQLDVDPMTDGTEPVATAPAPTGVAAAQRVATLEPMREGGPLGLLALIAAVCVVGVTIAAIRSIVSQRANRAEIA